MSTFQAPIGTHDVLAPQSALWEGMVATFAQFAYRYGFTLALTPMFEEIGVFNRGIGEHSDVMTKEMYVFTDRGEPTAPQRRALNDPLGGRTVPVAVVSGSVRVRGTVTALSWFNRKIRAFPPWALGDAIAYLEIPASRTDLIERELHKLRIELGVHRGA